MLKIERVLNISRASTGRDLSSQASSRRTTNLSKLSDSNNYLNLPRIDMRPCNLAVIQKELKDRGINVMSTKSVLSALDNFKNKKTIEQSNTNKAKMSQMRTKIEQDYNKCLQNTQLLDIADENKLKRALTLPGELSSGEIVQTLKAKVFNKSNEKKLERDLIRREKLLKKN